MLQLQAGKSLDAIFRITFKDFLFELWCFTCLPQMGKMLNSV
jgi:hypothetical protein